MTDRKLGTVAEEFRNFQKRWDKEKASLEKRRPSEEAYGTSSLVDWLELEAWQSHEGLCLLCDIEPFAADISWHGYENYRGVKIELPKINNVAFLREPDNFYEVPRRSELRKLEVFENRAPDCDDFDIRYKEFLINEAEKKLQRIWLLFNRTREFDGKVFGSYEPIQFIQWANKKNIEIPWLDWASCNGFIKSPRAESPAVNDGSQQKTPSDKRRNEGIEAAIAILRHKHANRELNDWQDFKRYVKKAAVVDYIRKNASDFPNCNKIKPKPEKNHTQSVKDREPTLTKSFPDFTKDPSIVAEYKKLIGKE